MVGKTLEYILLYEEKKKAYIYIHKPSHYIHVGFFFLSKDSCVIGAETRISWDEEKEEKKKETIADRP